MLEGLKITRFKSIKSQTLQFGRVNLFIGGNGTGKSSLLEAIGLAAACLGRGLGDSDIGNKGVRITPPELMKSSFKDEDLPKTLELDARFSGKVDYKATLRSSAADPLLRFFSESCDFRNRRIFGRSNRGVRVLGNPLYATFESNRGLWDQVKSVITDMPQEVVSAFAEFSDFAIYTPQTDVLRGRMGGHLNQPPVGLHGEGLAEAVPGFVDLITGYAARSKKHAGTQLAASKIMKACADLVWLPGWAKSVGVRYGDGLVTPRELQNRSRVVYFEDRYMHASRNKLSVYDSSEGTLFLLFAAILLSHPSAPKIFALDNVDNALNPKLTRKLVEVIIEVCSLSSASENGIGAHQVFLTSHNPTSLDAFDLFDDACRVFVVRRDSKGHTVADRLELPEGMSREEWASAKGGRNLSQLWLDGAIPGALGEEL